MKRLLISAFALSSILAAQPQCTNSVLRGTYAASYASVWGLMPQQGSPMPLTVPGAILGVVSIGYDGTLSGTETVIGPGQVKDYEIAGRIEINSDCTGTLRELTRLKGSSDTPITITERFVAISHPGGEIELQSTILGTGAPVGAMGIGIWKRISTVPQSAAW